MKKYILGIIIIFSVVLVSGCTDSGNNDENQAQTLAKNGISIKYPGTWVSANSKNNETIAAVADPNFIDSSTGFGKVSVVIQRKTLTSASNGTLEALINQTYKNIFSNSSFNLKAEGNTTIGKFNDVFECFYTEDQNGTVKKHRAVWIGNGNDVYIILCTAPESEFESQMKKFDFIINSFRIV
jgi:hypothetical protein